MTNHSVRKTRAAPLPTVPRVRTLSSKDETTSAAPSPRPPAKVATTARKRRAKFVF